ncbi:MAG: hypothetical protein ISS79_04220 [Phycisphaerae bacterium]|nr:hypothetical protein [Phycisphaerae bacterium]
MDILVGRLEAGAGTYAGCPSHPQASLEAATLTYATEPAQSSRVRSRRGVALLVVLFVIMVITVTSIGFLSKSDVELACGRNMELWTEVGYTADSGLEHARALIISPQELAPDNWTGDEALGMEAQQIVSGDDYYDLQILRDDSDPTDRCNYTIDCNSYRLQGGEKIGRRNITAQLRLDPCIAYWADANTTISQRVTINGDMYCAGDLSTSGIIRGDAFAGGTVSGAGITGRINENVHDANVPVGWPEIKATDYSSTYYSEAGSHSPDIIGSYIDPSDPFLPSSNNPGGVLYRDGDAELADGVNINGLLAVSGDVTIRGSNTITAVKNYPALLVGGDLIIEPEGALDVHGLAVVEGQVRVSSGGGDLDITGALFAGEGLVETVTDSSGNGNTGTMYGDPLWQAGKIDGALEFDGDNDYVQTSDNSDKLRLTNDYTLSVWIKPYSTQKSWAGVFSKCDPDGLTNHWTLQFNLDSTQLVIHHPGQLWDTGITLSDIAGAWHHIGVVRSGNTMTSYLGGNLRVSNDGMGINGPDPGEGHLNIGADRTASCEHVYKGLIDDVRIYNRALDPNENEIYPPIDGLPGLIGHWRLDEGGCEVDITAAPCKTAIMTWSSEGLAEKWEQVGDAFFRSITRE